MSDRELVEESAEASVAEPDPEKSGSDGSVAESESTDTTADTEPADGAGIAEPEWVTADDDPPDAIRGGATMGQAPSRGTGGDPTPVSEPGANSAAAGSERADAEREDLTEELGLLADSRGRTDGEVVANASVGPDDGTAVGVDRWGIGLTAGLVAGAAGVLTGTTAAFVAGVVPLAFALYGYATRPPAVELDVERRIDTAAPTPGSEIGVTVTVENTGSRPLADVRIADGAPARMPVVSGTPRHSASLRPGEATTFSYRLAARRGDHAFGDLAVVARNVSGTGEHRITADLACEVTCSAGVDHVPLTGQTIQYAGRVPTDAGGEGVEFYSTRKYQPGDPMSRVDWKRYARSNELTTIDFRENRAATVVVVVDTREDAQVAPDDESLDGVELGTYAGVRLIDELCAETNRVGVATYGEDGGYLAPGTGETVALRAAKLFGGDLDTDDPAVMRLSGSRPFRRLRRSMPDDAQVLFVSPVLDRHAVDVARRFTAYGHAVTVVSPDVTGDSPGGRVAGIDRARRLESLREHGSHVVDWSPDRPLRSSLDAARRRWSA
jgi:uncharacterized repeat protein (TIGR01451 family)